MFCPPGKFVDSTCTNKHDEIDWVICQRCWAERIEAAERALELLPHFVVLADDNTGGIEGAKERVEECATLIRESIEHDKDYDYRFDVIEIYTENDTLNHIIDAF